MVDDTLPPPLHIGLMCGTFDPPHRGHLDMAHQAMEQLGLNKVHFLPVGQPTHKTTLTAAEHRINMTQLAIAEHEFFQLDRTDVNRPGPHYTATLLPLLQTTYKEALLWLIIGGDSMRDFLSWHEPQKIVQSGCRLAVYERPGVHIDWPTLEATLPGLRAIVTLLTGPLVDISSTAVRAKAAAGEPLPDLVPAAVRNYIKEHQLYVTP